MKNKLDHHQMKTMMRKKMKIKKLKKRDKQKGKGKEVKKSEDAKSQTNKGVGTLKPKTKIISKPPKNAPSSI